jgi:hypothetical protein
MVDVVEYFHDYGFHDLRRRAFATHDAPKLSASVFQSLMRHQNSQTVQNNINMAKQLDDAVGALHTPPLRKNRVFQLAIGAPTRRL